MVEGIRQLSPDWDYEAVTHRLPRSDRKGQDPAGAGQPGPRLGRLRFRRLPSASRSRSSTTRPCRRWAATRAAACCSSAWAPGLGSCLIIDGSDRPAGNRPSALQKGKVVRAVHRRGRRASGAATASGRRRFMTWSPGSRPRWSPITSSSAAATSNGSRELPPNSRPGDNSHAFIGGVRLWEEAK